MECARLLTEPHDVSCQQIATVAFLGHKFHLEITLPQVDEIFLWTHLESHGIDTRVERVDFHKTSGGHNVICGGYFEQAQAGIRDSRQTGVGHHVRHRLLLPLLLVPLKAACNHWMLGRFEHGGRTCHLYTLVVGMVHF